MKIIKKVNRIIVKRSFVTSQYIRKYRLVRKRYLPELSREEFKQRLLRAKEYVQQCSEKDLDRIIEKEYKKRFKAYNSVDWYIGEVSNKEVGVWKKAGGLPLNWTRLSLAETVNKVKQALKKDDKKVAKRAKRSIPRILDVIDLIEKEKYLYPIILPGGTMGRKKLKTMQGDIDDGCMRAIALGLTGKKKFMVYIGFSKKKESISSIKPK